MTTKKVAIVAFGPTARAVSGIADDPTWEIWGLNNGYNHPAMYDLGHRLIATRWFELHEMRVQPPEDLAWLARCPVPVYLVDTDLRVPNGIRFPIEEVEKLYPLPSPFWACSFSYMIAFAMLEGFTTIGLFGFEFSSPREWIAERPNVLFWAGYAAGKGVELVVPRESTLLHHPHRYGLEYDHEAVWTDKRVRSLLSYWMQPLCPRSGDVTPEER